MVVMTKAPKDLFREVSQIGGCGSTVREECILSDFVRMVAQASVDSTN